MQLSSTAPRLLSQSHPLTTSFSINGGEGLKIEPSHIKFESVQPGILYVMTFSVRNTTKMAQRIRIQSPKTGYFALNYVPSGPIAPGLDIRGEIECQIPEKSKDLIFTDKIIATMGNNEVELHLYACKPHAIVKFEKSIHLGNIIRGTTVVKDVTFVNDGLERGYVKLSIPPECDFKISPMKFDLNPLGIDGYKVVAKLTMDAKKTGLHREVIKVTVSGALEDQILDVSGQVIEQSLTLVADNKNGKFEGANFGNIFFGQSKSITAYLVNSGPEPLNFTCNFEEEDEENGGITNISHVSTSDAPQTDDKVNSKYITISPLDGMVKAFSQFPVTVTFSPLNSVPARGFLKQQVVIDREEKLFSRKLNIECTELGTKIPLSLQGNSILPCASLSPTLLRFGYCPINDRRDIIVTFTNKTKFATKYNIPSVANFKFSPSHGLLQGLQTISIIASFLPPQLGEFKNTVKMSLADGLEHLELRLVGGSSDKVKKVLIGGTDKLPEDFKVQHKFVDPEEEETARLDKKNELEQKRKWQATLSTAVNKLAISAISADDASHSTTNSAERNEVYRTDDITDSEILLGVDGAPVTIDSRHPLFLKKQNDKIYDNYLRDSQIKRTERKKTETLSKLVARGAINPSDPFNINLGMEKEMDEPELKIPVSNEPLWLANSRGKGGDGGSGASRLPTDENRLINKKYSSVPATQAEIRDCKVELNLDQLKLVVGSHKVRIYLI